MSNEELMKPRVIVTAPYPNNHDFPVGKIIDFHPWESSSNYWEHAVEDCQGKRTWLLDFFVQYPHLFRRLEWWEDRKPEDMPEYVKTDSGITVIKPRHFLNTWGKPVPKGCTTGGKFYSYSNLTPATEAEYTSSLTSKPKNNE